MSSYNSQREIITAKYADLDGTPITLTDAAEKYDVPRRNIANWVKRGYITVIKSGYGMTVNEADVAYCVSVYRHKKTTGIGFRGPLLDKRGLPYTVKWPELSAYRRSLQKAD